MTERRVARVVTASTEPPGPLLIDESIGRQARSKAPRLIFTQASFLALRHSFRTHYR